MAKIKYKIGNLKFFLFSNATALGTGVRDQFTRAHFIDVQPKSQVFYATRNFF
jgi:hypothetical protein